MASGWPIEPLFEREGERAALETVLDAGRSGDGAAVVVKGPAGVGKTSLLREGARLAEEGGLRPLRAGGATLERELPFAVAVSLLEGAARADPGTAFRGAAEGARGVLAGGAQGPPPDPRGADLTLPLLHALYWTVANLAAETPVALLVDDLQWVDAATLRFLAYLARRLDGLPVALIAAQRSGEPAADPAAAAAIRAAASEVLDLAPLSAEAVAELVGARMQGADPEFSAACAAASAGNPLYVRELVSALIADGVRPDAAGARRLEEVGPEAIARAVLGRIASLGPEAARLVEAAAVLGDGTALREAAALAKVDPADAPDAADALAAADVLESGEPLRFVHPLVKEAVEADRAPAAQARDHLRAAHLRSEAGAPAEAIASHLLHAERSGEPWATDALRRAAADARRRGDPGAAARMLARALDGDPPRPVRLELLRELGSAEALVAEGPAEQHLREAWELAEDGKEEAEVALDLARVLLMLGRLREGVEVCEQALRSGAPRERVLRRELDLVAAARLDLSTRSLALERLGRLRRDPPPAGSPEELMFLANVAYEDTIAARPAAEASELAERALGEGRLLASETADSPIYYLAANALTLCERFEASRAALEAGLADSRSRGSVLGFAIASCFLADVANRSGEPLLGGQHAAASLEAAEGHGWELGLPAAAGFLADALLERGEVAEAAAAVQRTPLGEADPPDSVFFIPVLFSRGRTRIAQGDREAGLEDLLETGRRLERWGSPNPSVLPWRSEAALALARAGEPDRARELAAEELRLAEAFGAPRAIAVARRAAALLEHSRDDSIDRLRAALDALPAADAPLERARLQCELGAALRRDGMRRDSRPPLREVLQAATQRGALALAARAEDELRATGARSLRAETTGAGALTPSERRVCEMAAEGMSNPEIAESLFVTRRTVETHLTSAYRKLDIGSRRELAGALGAAPGAA